jgi:two-component system chemotaxis response regulator CheY
MNMGKRLLIVDDSAVMRGILKQTLSDAGYTIAGEAPNGVEAVKAYDNLHPDLVIMDIMMPEMDGVKAVVAIRALDPEARILMCSSIGQESMIDESFAAGATMYIVKPFENEQLLEAVNLAIGGTV